MSKKAELQERLDDSVKQADLGYRSQIYWEVANAAISAIPDGEGDRIAALLDHLDSAWGVIANAGWDDGGGKSPGWREAAEKWRDKWHKMCSNKTEKPFVPTEPGLYLWREKPTHKWQGYNLKDAEKDSLFCQPTGGEWADEMDGEWHPDRILMPGEE